MHRSWLVWSVALLAACGSPPPQRIQPIVDSGQLMVEARAAFRRGQFERALLAYRKLQFELNPAQPEMAEARYYAAECTFQTGDPAGAVLAFQKVAEEFPTSLYAPLALLRGGDANRRQWRRPDVDPSPGEAALANYQELVGRYPDSDAAGRAQLHIHELNEWFAEKAYKTGMFYFRRKAYDSGLIYFKTIVATYPDTRWVPPALLRLVDGYRAIGYAEELKETCANLRQYYPKTEGLNSRCPAEASAGAQ
jgi:outer membrane protein assembly factor BamD